MKKIVKVRILNSILIALMVIAVGLGLYSSANSDGLNRYQEGKAFGGSIAIIGVVLLVIGIVIVEALRSKAGIRGVRACLKEIFFIILDNDWLKKKHKKKKKF